MHYQLITLMGNDQKLKDSIYLQYSGVVLVDQQIPVPYSEQVLKTIQQDSSIRYSILNTPSTINKNELISLWNNMISISKLEDIQNCLIVYCFTDTQNDISQLLNDLHTQMGCQINQSDIILLTQHQTLIDCNGKNNLKITLIDRYQFQAIFPLIKKSRSLRVSNLTPRIYQENKIKEIAFDQYKIILSKLKEIIEKSKTQEDVLKNILLKQLISQIIKKLQVDFQSQVQIFDLVVNIREILEERKKDFIDVLMKKSLSNSYFRYCSNQNCMWLYSSQSSQNYEQLYQIEIWQDSPTPSNHNCPVCLKKTFYLSYQQTVYNIFQEFQFRLIKDIAQLYQQQDSKEILQNLLQIMFLFNEEEENPKIFNIIQQHYSTDKPKQCKQFIQSSIINNKYRFHHPPPFNFIKDSENTINIFRDYFFKNEIHFFFVLVKFERTDIMIPRITNIIQKIHNLDRKKMALIVNQCLCEQELKLELETRLAFFGFKTINFISNDSPTDICKTLFQTLEKVEIQRFDFTYTIFEQENDNSDQQQLKENLINMSRQIEAEQKNNFRSQLDQDKGYLEKLEMEIKMLEETLRKKKVEQRDLYQKYQQDSQKLNAWEKSTITFKL